MPITIKNIILDKESMSLVADEVTTTYVNRRVSETLNKKLRFKLREISETEIREIRKTNIPSFVLKMDDKLYYAKVPKNLRLVGCSIIGKHLCAADKDICHRLSAASDEEGGCARIRQGCVGIERYPWITAGYETFNVNHSSFVVAGCEHYKKRPPRPETPIRKLNDIKLGLASFVWEDVETLADARRRAKRNTKYYQ